MGPSYYRGICVALALFVGVASGIEINEIRVDQPGNDSDEYFELVGTAGASLDGLSYVVIGDSANGSGVIEALIPLDGLLIPDDGFFLATEGTFSLNGEIPDLVTSLNFENGDNVTHLLVSDFSLDFALGDDLETSDPEDSVLDEMPWGSVLDAIGLVESTDFTAGGTEYFYGDFLGFNDIGPTADGFVPAHVFSHL